jgi:hypothetical protein
MKKLLFIVLLSLAVVGWSFYFTTVFLHNNEIKTIEKEITKKVTDSIQNRLSFKYDSLKLVTDRKYDSLTTLYLQKKTKTIIRYEKVLDNIDVIGIDDNIKLFTRYVSQKDSIK